MTSPASLDNPVKQLIEWKHEVEKKVCDILNTIELIPSQNERIQLVMDKLFDEKNNVSKSIILYDILNKIQLKDQATGKWFQDLGLKFYENNSKLAALINFTQAIAYTLPNTEFSSVLYNNRSQILYEYGMFESCLEDIERITVLHVPHQYKGAFFHRKATCHRKMASRLSTKVGNRSSEYTKSHTKDVIEAIQHNDKLLGDPIDKGNEVRYNPPLPILNNKNSLIPGLSDAVKLNCTNELGRFITATRDISPGELIGICKAHVSAVTFTERLRFCWHCTKSTWNGIPCDRCPCVIYCSDYCRERSFDEYHDHECNILPCLGDDNIDDISLLTVRTIIKAYKECGSKIDKLMSTYDINAKPPTENELLKSDHDPNKYSSIHMLSSEYNPTKNKDNSKYFAQSLIIAYHMGVSIGLVKHNETLSELKKFDKFMYLFGFIERTMRIIISNRVYHRYFDRSKVSKDVVLNSKIIPGTMHFKQQCYTDIKRVNQGEYQLIYTLNGIKNGQTIGDNFLYNFYEKCLQVRRGIVKLIFNFCCNCEACINDWSIDHSEPTGINKNDLEKIKDGISEAEKRIMIASNAANNYLRKNEKICDATTDINNLIEIVGKCQKYLKPTSEIFIRAKSTLALALDLTQGPILIPE
ncbi:SET and MYND domain-containing protein DDB_G0273589-like [Aphidius gifuensis]|uniref:SET and MYND domain-containing protein DDB_G0273589-like n=1 Tax=Aphidius gifuensis TaxID=684658 RepID=UPI001CDCEB55|nr:SET and MYND domain-containing protein DDB_G0273589-like [Aphidius gifuensis]